MFSYIKAFLITIFSLLIQDSSLKGHPPCITDLQSDTWVGTDALGRELPGAEQCPAPREGKFVGLFYFLWLGTHGQGGPYDITKLLAENPENPAYAGPGAFHHWGQSELGYYLSDSEYVIRKHAQMIADAGVDTLIFDVTNAVTYEPVYTKLCAVYTQMRAEGTATPQICFMTHSNAAATMQKLYDEFYAKGLYKELWFYWKGKPLLLGDPAGVSPEVKEFFSLRDCWAWVGGQDTWNWLEHSPQKIAWHESPDKPEEVSVCVAQHPTGNIGRSNQNGVQPPHDQFGLTTTMHQGLYFQQQWESALKIDPEFIFITGWNEWVAQRFTSDSGQHFLGKPLPKGGTFFVDAYNQEFSRDIEPMKDGHSDNYYYQMIAGIRQFKGIRPGINSQPPAYIIIDGQFDDWNNVQAVYYDTPCDTMHRNETGWGNAGQYVNNTGRNDFTRAMVAYDDRNIYFYIETRENISPATDKNWMMLFLDTDQNHQTGWQGYDWLINGQPASESTLSLAAADNRWNWHKTLDLSYKVSGNKMEICLPRPAISQEKAQIAFDFHWSDNIQKENDILEFSLSGDSAPNRRLNYRYNSGK